MGISLKSIRPRRFQFVEPTRAIANVRRQQRRYAQAIAKKMAEYPPKRNPGGYQRTYALQRGWQKVEISVSSDGSTMTMTNPVAWAVYAQGPRGGGRGKGERQTARMRALGWQSITDVARVTAPLYKELMNRAIRGEPG